MLHISWFRKLQYMLNTTVNPQQFTETDSTSYFCLRYLEQLVYKYSSLVHFVHCCNNHVITVQEAALSQVRLVGVLCSQDVSCFLEPSSAPKSVNFL